MKRALAARRLLALGLCAWLLAGCTGPGLEPPGDSDTFSMDGADGTGMGSEFGNVNVDSPGPGADGPLPDGADSVLDADTDAGVDDEDGGGQ